MTAALATVGLGRRYRTRWGLWDCTLSVPAGSVTGLVGPNGAGKTTLLRLVAGLGRPNAGSVSVFGEVVVPNGAGHLARIGYLDQRRPLYPFRIDELLSFGHRCNPRWDQAFALELLEAFGLPGDLAVPRLSVGQRAQVAATLCLAKRPDLLLLDEPVANLDPLARQQLLRAVMVAVAEHGTTVVISSHVMADLEPVCDHLVILASGRLQLAGPVETILSGHHLVVGPPEVAVPAGTEVVGRSGSDLQQTLLVHGAVPPGPRVRVQRPELEEIVLGYLANPGVRPGDVTPSAEMPPGDLAPGEQPGNRDTEGVRS